MSSLENEITKLISQIYENNLYPTLAYFVTEEYLPKNISEKITNECNVNAELIKCNNCHYCYQIAVSQELEIPILPAYSNKNTRRKNWIKQYGDFNYQMYIALSKLGKYAMIYWTKYRHSLFAERIEHVYVAPSEPWKKLTKCVKEILKEADIKTVSSSLMFSTYKVKYKGAIEGIDTQPTLKKLLFTEELH